MENFSRKLIDWYRENGRDLPWRRTKNPYLIWISEIILQQTRVVQGYDYYQRFVARFPDVFALAAADAVGCLARLIGRPFVFRDILCLAQRRETAVVVIDRKQ